MENMIVVPITKRVEIVTSIQVYLISRVNTNYKENGGKKKLFLQIQSIKIMYLDVENMIVVPITKRIKIIMIILVHLISWMNINYEENGGR